MTRVLNLLILIAALALFASACGSQSTAQFTASTSQLETQEAPDELAAVDDASSEADDDATTDVAEEAVADADSEMSDDGDDPVEAADESNEAEADPADLQALEILEDLADQTPAGTEAPSECVSDALDALPKIRTQWQALLDDETQADMSEASKVKLVEPVLECVSFGAIVAAVVADDTGLELSSNSVACIDIALAGEVDLLFGLVTGTGGTDSDEPLVAAVVNCVSPDELTKMMESR